MKWREKWKRWRRSPAVQTALFALGVILLLLAPVVGALPGPGGVFVLAAGLALSLQNSRWAKRRYVDFKRWQPRAGRWTDWGLRRASARRRAERDREEEAQAELSAPSAGTAATAPLPSPLAAPAGPGTREAETER